MAPDLEEDFNVPLPNVSGKILAKVIEYCKKHVEAQGKDEAKAAAEEELKTWDTDYVKVLDQSTLFELILVRRLPAATCRCYGALRASAP